MVTVTEIKAMKVAELKQTCDDLGLSKTGKKKVLQKRLIDHVESLASESSEVVEEVVEEEVVEEEAPVVEQVAEPTQAKTEEEKIQERKNKFGTKSKEDVLEMRKNRFNMVDTTEESKKKLNARLARFGMPAGADPASLLTDEKKRKRMERFGTTEPVDEDVRLTKRRKRFAKQSVTTEASNIQQEKAEARKARFNLGQSKEQLDKRRARFGL
jgi:hypothetical protein